MLELLYIFIILFVFYSSYIVTLFSLAVYIDPEDVTKLYPDISPSQKSIVERMAGDPRRLMQISEIYKSFSLIVLTVLGIELTNTLSNSINFNATYILIGGLFFLWIIYVLAAELLPRNYSRQAITGNMIRHLWLIFVIYLLFIPVIKLYKVVFKRSQEQRQITEDEIEDIVERAIETVSERAGIEESFVDEEEKEMITQIFQLDQTIVKEIMIPRINIVGFEKSMSFKQIKEIIKKDGHSRYPVYEETIDKIIGLVYVKDLFNNMPAAGEMFDITQYLRTPYLVPESKIIGELLSEFKEKHQHIAMVVDEYGGVAGLVTLEDIIEEIVGEIQDEHDAEEEEIIKLHNGRYLVDSSLLVEDLQDHFETEFEQGDYDTVGGLIYDLVGSVPDEGEKIKWNGYEFEIYKLEGQRIKTIKVKLRYKDNQAS